MCFQVTTVGLERGQIPVENSRVIYVHSCVKMLFVALEEVSAYLRYCGKQTSLKCSILAGWSELILPLTT